MADASKNAAALAIRDGSVSVSLVSLGRGTARTIPRNFGPRRGRSLLPVENVLPSVLHIRQLAPGALELMVRDHFRHIGEEEACAVLDNPHCTPQLCHLIAQNPKLTSFYSVRVRLVAHRATPRAEALKFAHYVYWRDLVRLSVDVTVPAPVRRAIDTLLLNRIGEMTLGEKITSAKRCSPALIKVLLFDPDPRVFSSLLVNQRLREEELVLLASSNRASPEHLRILANDRKWSYRYAIRKALVMNPVTPRSVAASQLRFLSRRDLRMIHGKAETSVYLRRCIERMDRVQVSTTELEI